MMGKKASLVWTLSWESTKEKNQKGKRLGGQKKGEGAEGVTQMEYQGHTEKMKMMTWNVRLSIQALPLMKGWKNPKYRAKKTYVI